MKILHLPLTVTGSEQVGQERGFREVFEDYKQFDYLSMEGSEGRNATNQALITTVKEYQPDIIWAQLQETDTISDKTWKQIREDNSKVWMTTWSGDARTYVPAGMQKWLPHFDIFYNDTDQVDLYKPYCKRYEFMPIAVDPDEATDFSHPTPNAPEIVFIGNDYGGTFTNGKFRKELMIALTKEFGNKFGIFGTGWNSSEVNVLGTCPVKHQGAYYNKAKLVISVDHIRDITHWSERLVWAMASGTPVLVQNQRNIRRLLTGGSLLPFFIFDTAPRCIEAVHKTLEEGLWFKELASEAKELALKEHTWKQRALTVKEDYE